MLIMKNLYKFLILSGLIMLGVSCTEDFVDLTNPNDHTTGSFWKNDEDAVRGINSVYMALYYDGLYMRLYPWLMDVRADDMRNTSPWWITDLSNYVTSPDNPCYINTWQATYAGIFWANQVLHYVPGIDMDDALKARIIGEAKFLRGLYHYHLVIAYRNIPVITDLPANSDEFFPSQSTPEEAWAQVIQDFTDAMEALPVKEDYAPADLGRATRGAAAGYLAKSYMINRRWSEAEPVLKAIIDGDYGNYSLIDNYRENFTEADENNSESLFEVQFEREVGGTFLGWVGDPQLDWSKTSGKARTYAPLGYGYGDITPTDWIYNEFMEELTENDSIDPRAKASMFFDYPGSLVYGTPFLQATSLPNYVHVRKYLNDDLYPMRLSGVRVSMKGYCVILIYCCCMQNALMN